MQVNLDSSKQTFGAIKTDKYANIILASRIKNPKKYIRTKGVIHSMDKSEIAATVSKHHKNSSRLVALINDSDGREMFLEESRFSSIFRSPMKFIKKVRKAMIKMEKKG